MSHLSVLLRPAILTMGDLDRAPAENFADQVLYAIASWPGVAIEPSGSPRWALVQQWLDNGTKVGIRALSLKTGEKVSADLVEPVVTVELEGGVTERFDAFEYFASRNRSQGQASDHWDCLEVHYIGISERGAGKRLMEGHHAISKALARVLHKQKNRVLYLVLFTPTFHEVPRDFREVRGADDELCATRDLIEAAEATLIEAYDPDLQGQHEPAAIGSALQHFEGVEVLVPTNGFRLRSRPTAFTQDFGGIWPYDKPAVLTLR